MLTRISAISTSSYIWLVMGLFLVAYLMSWTLLVVEPLRP